MGQEVGWVYVGIPAQFEFAFAINIIEFSVIHILILYVGLEQC